MIKVTISGGATIEPLDAVRYLSNRSSGKTGHFLYQAAQALPAVAARYLDASRGSAQQLYQAVLKCLPDTDILIMAAAVADFRPQQTLAAKPAKKDVKLVLELVPTIDILSAISALAQKPFLVGFCLAQASDLLPIAINKLQHKNIDMIIANPLENMGGDEGRAVVITTKHQLTIPLLPKEQLATIMMQTIIKTYQGVAIS